MPGSVPPVSNEREALVGFLQQQRYVLRLSAYGLTEEQFRASPARSPLSVGGLIKHVSAVERFWMTIATEQVEPFGARSQDDYGANFELAPGETMAAVLEDYAAAAGETDQLIASIADLGRTVPIPPDVPWFPRDVDAWSVRWVLLHLIEETARHAGHADIVREAVDGATAFPLMAAAEHWAPSPWLQPWEPATSTALAGASS